MREIAMVGKTLMMLARAKLSVWARNDFPPICNFSNSRVSVAHRSNEIRNEKHD